MREPEGETAQLAKVIPLRQPSPSEWTFDEELGRTVADKLRRGLPVVDTDFNRLFTPLNRRLARWQWTPVDVARRAAELLANGEERHILDIGSGVGKFCLVGALTTTAHFFGVERRAPLVDEANDLCRRLAVPRTRFVASDMAQLEWREFDAVYLYNPFYENIESISRIDETVPLSEQGFRDFVALTERRLAEAPRGMRIVTFHGFGGKFPEGYEMRLREWWMGDYLELWVKA